MTFVVKYIVAFAAIKHKLKRKINRLQKGKQLNKVEHHFKNTNLNFQFSMVEVFGC